MMQIGQEIYVRQDKYAGSNKIRKVGLSIDVSESDSESDLDSEFKSTSTLADLDREYLQTPTPTNELTLENFPGAVRSENSIADFTFEHVLELIVKFKDYIYKLNEKNFNSSTEKFVEFIKYKLKTIPNNCIDKEYILEFMALFFTTTFNISYRDILEDKKEEYENMLKEYGRIIEKRFF